MDLEKLQAMLDQLPESTLVLRERAAAMMVAAVERRRSEVAAGDVEGREPLARSLNGLSARLSARPRAAPPDGG